MKISKAEQKKVRKKLLNAAIEIITKHGYQKATMLKISKKAEVGDSTIYKYFPSKEKFIFAYFEDSVLDAIDVVAGIEDFNEYSIQEKLQTLMESTLDIFSENRKFVQIGLEIILTTPFNSYHELQPTKKAFTAIVMEIFEAAIEANEIPQPPFQQFMVEVMADYFKGIILYWTKDDSEDQTSTSQVIDMSLNLLITIIKSGIVSKGLDLFMFFMRQHLIGFSSNLGNIFKTFTSMSSISKKQYGKRKKNANR